MTKPIYYNSNSAVGDIKLILIHIQAHNNKIIIKTVGIFENTVNISI